MNIAQALKEKNRLLKKIKEIIPQITVNNRYRTDDTTKRESSDNLLKAYRVYILELAELKQKIAIASGPIQSKIALIGLLTEYKTTVESLNSSELPDNIPVAYGTNPKEVPVVVIIKNLKKQELIAETKIKIDQLQDEIDNFNAITQV